MSFAFIPVLILLVVAGGISAFFSIIFYRNRSVTRGGVPLTVIMVAVTLWAFSAAVQVFSPEPALQFAVSALELTIRGVIPVAFILFSLQYSGRIGKTVSAATWILLLLVPAVTGTILLLVPDAPFTLFDATVSTLTPVLWVFIIYNVFLLFLGLAFLIQIYQSATGVFRNQLFCMVFAVIVPLLMHFAYVLRINPFGILDLAPVGCIISIVALAAGIERYGLFDLVPIEHGIVLMEVPAGIIVVDNAGRIVEINPPALRILGVRSGSIIGQPVSAYLSPEEMPSHPRSDKDSSIRRSVIQRDIEGTLLHVEIRCMPLLSRQGERQGRMLLLSDITDQKLIEQSLAIARRNVNLLTSITRHDILNQLTVIMLHNEILRETVPDPEVMKSLLEQDKAAKNIRRLIAFTKDYEKLGENLPEWLDIEKIFNRLTDDLGYDYIRYTVHVDGIEVFADPFITRVFNNLLDNSLRYGQKVTTIRLYTSHNIEGVTIIYEDNGVGIPAKEKARIFTRGCGRNTGFGLFFAREILSLTGITIRETGQEGAGARFEIMVPWGRFRTRRDMQVPESP
jgi:PAS domain S-box-containing protein